MITTIKADGAAERRQLDAMRARAAEKNADIEQAVKDIMADVKANGLSAVERYSVQFDHSVPYELPKERLDRRMLPARESSSRRWSTPPGTSGITTKSCWSNRQSGRPPTEDGWGASSGG